jgi:glycosyltransferase involved in cell wall biosynthesis
MPSSAVSLFTHIFHPTRDCKIMPDEKESVQILLSAYNGEKYIGAQLQSLSAQTYDNLFISFRDDGSTDDTADILRNFIKSYPKSEFTEGINIGAVKSFFELLKLSSDSSSYFAFCDQDDVWENDKIARAVKHLDKLPAEKPAMYFCRLNIVDENLKHIAYSPIPSRKPSFKNALVENIATGSTIVINRAARTLILSRLPENAPIHDWWIYVAVSAFGEIVYDEKPLIKYRQHGSNAIGIKTGLLSQLRSRMKRFLNGKGLKSISLQAGEFYDIYGNLLNEPEKQIIEAFLFKRKNIYERLKYALTMKVYRQTAMDDFILRMLILLNRI